MKAKCLILLLLLAPLWVAAESVQFQTKAPSRVAEGEAFQVQFTVNSEVDQIKAPSWGNFKLLAGPFSSVSQSTSIMNGRVSKMYQQTETYTLEATKAGSYNIPGATIVVGGKTYKSNAVKITVVKGSGGQVQSGQTQSSTRTINMDPVAVQPRRNGQVTDKDIFIRTELSKTDVYEQECVLLSYKLYYTMNINQLRAVKVPDWNNFGKQDIANPDKTHRTETLNGRTYETVNLYQVILYPTKAGDYTLDPADFEAELQVETGINPQNIFGGFLDTYDNVVKALHANGATLHARPLPKEGRPASFKGAVGQFELTSKLSSNHVKANEPITLTLTLTGMGNLKMINSPTLTMPQEFEVYDPKVTQKLQVSTQGVGGSKVIEYMVIPREKGNYVVPAVEFSYFDPETAEYKTLRSPSYDLQVDEGDASSARSKSFQKGQNQIAQDIRYIAMDGIHPKVRGGLLFSSWWALLLYLVPLLIVVGVLLWLHKPVDAQELRRRQAQKKAQKHLKNAKHCLKQGDADHYLEEMQHATETLLQEAQTEEEKMEYQKILDQCQYARYAPDQDLKAMMTRIESLLKVLILVFAISFAGDISAESLVDMANQNYAKGDYEGAAALYEKALEDEGEAPELYYNLANAQYKHNDIGHAVLNYERALLLKPGYEDAQYNLEFVKQQVVDDIGTNYVFFLRAWWLNLKRLYTPNGWAWISLVCFWLFLAMVVLFVLGREVWHRKTGFFAGLALLMISAFGAYFAFELTQEQKNKVMAVVVQPICNVKGAPAAGSANLFVVHEGTEARIVDRMDDWCRLEFGNETQGWVKDGDIETVVK